uniref:Ig-like domain-containing protein n=1 Tax=Maylandia zebra TaxID=106582 RepID=A0A3P9DFM7_9CICH
FINECSLYLSLSFTVRDGDKVTLPCENMIKNHHSCDTTTWLFTDSRGKAAVELVNLGQIKETVKSDRLSVTAECSLVIKKVTAEDVGRYTCRQFRGNPGKQQGPDAVVYLSDVISEDQVTLNSSVQVHGHCEHKVKWIHYSEGLNRDYSNIKTLQSSCSATVTFVNSLYSHISNSDFKCNVTTEDGKEQLFTFSPHSSEVRDALQNVQNSLNSNIQITCVTLSILTLSYNFITNKLQKKKMITIMKLYRRNSCSSSVPHPRFP